MLIFMFSMFHIQGQDCEASIIFQRTDIKKELENSKCVSLNVIPDPNGMEFDYLWKMGDGKVQKGEQIEHCYDDYGVYTIRLNLFDPNQEFSIFNEVTSQIELERTITADIEVFGDKSKGESYVKAQLKAFENESVDIINVFWSFGDGSYGCGDEISYKYPTGGDFEVKAVVQGLYEGSEFYLLATKPVFIPKYNIDGVQIVEQVIELNQLNESIFLKDNFHMKLLEIDGNDTTKSFHEIGGSSYYLKIIPNVTYKMVGWYGNMLARPIDFSTDGIKYEEIDSVFDYHFDRLVAEQNLVFFEDLIFIKNSSGKIENEEQFEENIKELNSFPIKVSIGFFGHTGGSPQETKRIAEERVAYLSKLIKKKIKQEDKISFVTFENDPALLNSCEGVINCTVADPSFNCHAQFKIEDYDF